MPQPRRNQPAPETQARLQKLGLLLAKLRQDRGLSQRELGLLVEGSTKVFISQVETGRARIPDKLIPAYVAALSGRGAGGGLARTLLANYEPEAHRLIYGGGGNEGPETQATLSGDAGEGLGG